MKQVKLKEHIDRIVETAQEDLWHVLFVYSSRCTPCIEYKDVVTNELDVNLFSNVEFSSIDAEEEPTPFMTVAVPGMILHYKGMKFVELIEIPRDSRGRVSAAGIEEFVKLCIEERDLLYE